MTRPRSHFLEKESRLALKSFLPREWLVLDISPDCGLDTEVTIVKGEEVTNLVFWLQLKATVRPTSSGEPVSTSIKAGHLRYYESCRTPVLILFWIEPNDAFYYLLAQRYIREELSAKTPNWRDQRTVTITFPPGSRLLDPEKLESIATDGWLCVLECRLVPEFGVPCYWLDGIPQSDDEELKARTATALVHVQREEHRDAIAELEDAIEVLTLAPAQRMSLLLSLGNAYLRLSEYGSALANYRAILDSVGKVSGEDALQGKAAALSNIGLISSAKGDLRYALLQHQRALQIHTNMGYKPGQAAALGNIGLVYWDMGVLGQAVHFLQQALRIHAEIGYKRGQANALGNIGLIYSDMADRDQALSHQRQALAISTETGHAQGQASALGNIGLVLRAKGDPDGALDLLRQALRIYTEIGCRQGQAATLANIGLILRAMGVINEALRHHQQALQIHRDTGYKRGQVNQLANIGFVSRAAGNHDQALRYLREALAILDQHELAHGRDVIEGAIAEIAASHS